MSGYDNDDRYEDDRYEDDRYEDDRNINDYLDVYQFEVRNNQVVGVIEYENGQTERDRVEWDEQWSIDGDQVIKREWDDGYVETTVFADVDGDGFFTEVSETYESVTTSASDEASDKVVNGRFVGDVYWNDGYKFTFAENTVTQIIEIDDGFEQVKPMDQNESWFVQSGNVIGIETYGNFTETTVYADTDGDGVYNKIMESYDLVAAPTGIPTLPLESKVNTAIEAANENLVTVFGKDGIVDDIYRIYEAAFDREADANGLGYWVAQAKLGTSLMAITESFASSQEFTTRYGEDMPDSAYVQALYQNVLDRRPDGEGEAYWIQKLAANELTEAEVLAEFANSVENIANTESALLEGIQYSAFVS